MWNKKINLSKIPDVVNQLFSDLPSERFSSFSCGHIIPSSNLQTLVVSKGPCGGALEYKAGKQSDLAAVCASICL
jgi:chromosome transmission fidelity protein 1